MTVLPASTVVNVNVSVQQGVKSLVDFGRCCVFTENIALSAGDVETFLTAEAFNARFTVDSSLKDFGNVFFAQNPIPTELVVAFVDTTNSNYPDTIQTVRDSNNFYAVALDKLDLESVIMTSIAQKVEQLELLMIVGRGSPDIDSIADTLKTANSSRTALIVIDDITVISNRPDAAWLGFGLTRAAGTINWANNTLNSTIPTAATQSQITTWLSNDINVYATVADTNLTLRGTTLATNKTYIDQIEAKDFLKTEITENILSLLNSQARIPFTDAGVKSIEAEIINILKSQQNIDGILDPTVRVTATAPSVTTLTPEQRATRIAPTISCTARLAGAINMIIINVFLEI